MLGSAENTRRGFMSRSPSQLNRRKFLRSAALGTTATAALLHAPAILRAQGAGVKIGSLHSAAGARPDSGRARRVGVTLAIADVHASGGVEARGSARFAPMLGDARSTPEGGTAEVEKMSAAGACTVVG